MKCTGLTLLLNILVGFSVDCQTSELNGQVVDAITREFIPGAIVILADLQLQTQTNETGQYAFEEIEPGIYTLVIEHTGFEKMELSVEVKPGQSRTLVHSLEPTVFKLAAIEITAEPESNAKTISAIDIQLRSVNTSQDILRMVPGLFIAQHAGGGKAEQIFLRGFDIDHGTDIAITTDGIPVNMVSHAHGQGYADLHYLIPETVDRVHFGKGPYHTHHGNLATAGYVGFETLNRLEENTLALQVGEYNSFRGLAMLNLLDQQSPESSRNAYFAGEFNSTDGYFDSPQDFKRYSVFGKYNSTLGRGHWLTATLSSFASRWNASGQIPQRAVDNGMISFFGAIDDTEGGETSRSNANLKLSSTINQNSWMSNQVYYSKYDFELYSNFTFFLEDSIHGDQIRQKEDRHLFGYIGSYSREDSWLSTAWKTEFGVQFRKDLSMDNELSHTADRTTLLERMAYGDIRESNLGIFLNETIRFGKNVTLNAGLRFDHFDFSYMDQITATPFKRVSDNIFSPKLNAYMQITDDWQLFGNIGYGFHSNDTRVVVAQEAFETLPRALGMDIGTLWKPTSTLIISTTLWHLDLDQEFVYVGDAAIVEPSGRTRRMGIEFSGRWQLLEWLYADADINFTEAYARDEPEGLNYVPLAPRFSSIGGITVKTGKHWNGSLRYRHLGDRPANEDNSVMAVGYTVADVLIGYRINALEIGLNIENLFNLRWREAQFDTESRLKDEMVPVTEIHFTAGTPINIRAHVAYHF